MINRFLAIGQYVKVWGALKLPAAPQLSDWRQKTEQVCALQKEELLVYRQQNGINTYTEVGSN